jgi:hypothetical protein
VAPIWHRSLKRLELALGESSQSSTHSFRGELDQPFPRDSQAARIFLPPTSPRIRASNLRIRNLKSLSHRGPKAFSRQTFKAQPDKPGAVKRDPKQGSTAPSRKLTRRVAAPDEGLRTSAGRRSGGISRGNASVVVAVGESEVPAAIGFGGFSGV